MEIIDTHTHYWEPSLPERPWDTNADAPAPEPLLAEQLLLAAREAGVSRVVQVNPSLMGYDNRYSFDAAQAHPDLIAGVFARINPLESDMSARLTMLRKTPKFLGIRITLLTPAQKSWLSDSTLALLFEEAGEHGFPVAIYAKGLAREIGEAVRKYPGARILIDHMALDDRKKGSV